MWPCSRRLFRAPSTWHDECIGVALNGAPVIQPAQCGRWETSSFTRERHKVVHHHRHVLGTQADNGGRHWKEKRTNLISYKRRKRVNLCRFNEVFRKSMWLTVNIEVKGFFCTSSHIISHTHVSSCVRYLNSKHLEDEEYWVRIHILCAWCASKS